MLGKLLFYLRCTPLSYIFFKIILQAIFWVLEAMIPFCNNPLFLFFFGWMLPPKPAFMKFTTTPVVRAMTFTKQVFQDIVLPINR